MTIIIYIVGEYTSVSRLFFLECHAFQLPQRSAIFRYIMLRNNRTPIP